MVKWLRAKVASAVWERKARPIIFCRSLFVAIGLWVFPLSATCQDRLLLDDFETVSNWTVTPNISGDGNCELSFTEKAKAGTGAMLVVDRCPSPHAQWLVKRCADGVWDLSKWQELHVWIRGDGSHKKAYFKAADESGKQTFWSLGDLHDTDWRLFTMDITRGDSCFRDENPNLARISAVGLRLAPHCGYQIAFDDMWLSSPVPEPVVEWPQPRETRGERIGYLSPRHVNEIDDSIVGVNLHPGVGQLTEADIDMLAGAGVKWAARAPIDLDSPYDKRLRKALLRHQFKLHGIFGVNRLLEGQELNARLDQVQRTVAGLKEYVGHWEIGNEPNVPKFWSGKPNATEFGLMVKAFAQAIRREQPDAAIISGGLVGYPLDFAGEMLDTGMGQWVDYIGIHTPRSRPEDGGRGKTHEEALAAFRELIRSYNPKLEVWQTEVQATPNVNFSEVVGGITDYQQARHVGRRFFIEQWLGYPASFWQLFKAGPTLDHPGALLRIDGTPTLKFFAIQNVAAILDSRLKPSDINASADVNAAPLQLWHDGARRELRDGGTHVSPAVHVPPGVNVDLIVRATTESNVVHSRLVWLDAAGREVQPISAQTPVRVGPGAAAICLRYPHMFRPENAVAMRVEIAAPSRGQLVTDELRVIAHAYGYSARTHVFRRSSDGALFVTYWLTPRPPVQTIQSVCTLSVASAASAFQRPALIDMIDGSVYDLPGPTLRNGRLVFANVPITDYAMVVADARSIRVQPVSTLVAGFNGADALTRQFVADRFGRGRPEFWRRMGEALEQGDGELAQAYRQAHRLFVEQLEPVEGKVEARGLPMAVARLEQPAWRGSIVNANSKHVDRYFVQIAAPGLDASRIRVVVNGESWPQRRWQDSPMNVGSYFWTEQGGAVRVFVVVPDSGGVPEDAVVEYAHTVCDVRAFCFRNRRTGDPCIACWIEPLQGQNIEGLTTTLVGPRDCLPASAEVWGVTLHTQDTAGDRALPGVPLRSGLTLIGGDAR